MRVHADRQTLILAGEALPRRNAAATSSAGRITAGSQRSSYLSPRATVVVTDAEVTDAEYTPSANPPQTSVVTYEANDVGNVGNNAGLPTFTPARSAITARAYSSYASSNRASAFSGASAYARTQDLSDRHPIIDTYA